MGFNYKKFKILFIAGGAVPHPFHATLAKSINANFYYTSKKGIPTLNEIISSIFYLPRDYDIYLSETIFFIPTVARILKIIPKHALILNIVADPVMYNIVNKNKKNKLPDFVNRFLLKKVDGFIFVGKWGHLLNELNINKPYVEIFGGVDEGLMKKLERIKITEKRFHNNHRIVFIGNVNPKREYYKGIDIIIEAIKKVRNKFSDVEFFITGQSYLDEKYSNCEFVKFTGEISLEKELQNFSLAVFMGRGDTFPIGSLEAMCAGLPTFVSTDTGAKEIVKKVNKEFICELDSDLLAKKMIEYFEMSDKKKVLLAKRFRKEAMHYTIKAAIKNFKEKFTILLDKIDKNLN